MEAAYAWAKNLIVSFCLLELFCHLVRNADYRRYLRFFGGIIILLMVISPVLQVFSAQTTFEDMLRQALLQEEVVDMELAQETLAGLQNSQISRAYQLELERQIREIALAHDQSPISVRVNLEEEQENFAQIREIEIVLPQRRSAVNVFEEEKETDSGQQAAIREIEVEVAAVYGIARADIKIRVKE